jgi:hypothetical protein
MSQENVEIVRRVSDAYNGRDVGAMLDELHPEIEWHPWLQLQFGGGASVYRGHQGVRKGIRELEEAFSEIQAEQTEIRDLGERVVAIGLPPGTRQRERRDNRIGNRLDRRVQGWQGDSGPRVSRP